MKAQSAMGPLSSEDQSLPTSLVFEEEALPTNSPIVQKKLAKMKKLLKKLNDRQTYHKGMAYYDKLIQSAWVWEEAAKAEDAMRDFGTEVLLYENELKHNIDKIETCQFVMLSELLPLRGVPRLVNMEDIIEAINAEKDDERTNELGV